jgi:predicted nucleic acid-binding protein
VPAPLYCDTSALLKLYLPEPGSSKINRLAEGRTDLVISDLAVTEAASALARRMREGALTSAMARRVLRAIVEALDGGVYRRVDLAPDVYRRAEHLLLSLGTPLRALDALHLALAISVRAASLASFDVRLAAAARAAGLVTYPA